MEGPSGLNGVDDSNESYTQSPGIGPKIEEDCLGGEMEKRSYTTSHPDSVEEPEGEGVSDDHGFRNNRNSNYNPSTEQRRK